MREDRRFRARVRRLRHRRPPRPRIPLALATLALAALGFAQFCTPVPRLVWNASASAPVGLYWLSRAAPARGDLVLAMLPPHVRQLAAERGYLPTNVPLVKQLAAVPGDVICALDGVVFVNGRAVAEQRQADHRRRPLPRWNGCRLLRADQVLLLMAGESDSFDGRYFGPVPCTGVLGRLVPLWRS
jgi:conjugative transfer signal peptidase TraF